MHTVWVTVDRLVHDLGAIRAFVDEAAAVPEASDAPQVARVHRAMNAATDAITRIFNDSQDSVIEDAWQAIARAQDAVRDARALVAAARASRESASSMTHLARRQAERAREHAQAIAEQAERVRRGPRPPDRKPARGVDPRPRD